MPEVSNLFCQAIKTLTKLTEKETELVADFMQKISGFHGSVWTTEGEKFLNGQKCWEKNLKELGVNELHLRNVENMGFSVRTLNCLRVSNIKIVGELVQRTEVELLSSKIFEKKSIREIKNILSSLDLFLKE